MKITKKIDGNQVSEVTPDAKAAHKKRTLKLKEKMSGRMGITTEPADMDDPFAQGQVNRQIAAEVAQPGADDTGATTLADTTEATAAARETNKHEWALNFHFIGDLLWTDGTVVFADETCGKFSRNYFLTKVVHRIYSKGSGYSTNIEGHGCLEGY
jgi:RecA/RadA recombinase